MPDLGLEVLWKGKNFVRLLGGLWVALRISLIAAGISIVLGILLGVAASRKRSAASLILLPLSLLGTFWERRLRHAGFGT